MDAFRVLLADRDYLVREGIAAVLCQQPNIEIVGHAACGQEAVEHALRLLPDVVVTEIDLPVLNGFEVAREILHRVPTSRIAALTRYEDAFTVRSALRAGILGYFTKRCTARDLQRGLHEVSSGRRCIDPRIVGVSLLECARAGTTMNGDGGGLTSRERQVLQLLAEGYSTSEAARQLGLAAKTVGVHRGRLMRKLDIHTLADLVRYAVGARVTSADV